MQRLFFHFWSQDDRYPDHIGREMGGLAAAHQHARKLIDDVLSFRGMDQEGSRWAVMIADAQGRIVLTVLFPRRQTNLSTSAPVRDARDRLSLLPTSSGA